MDDRPVGKRRNRESIVRQALPIYLALLFAILTVFMVYVIVNLTHVLVILFISVLFASAISGPASRLEQLRVPRAVAALAVYLMAGLGIVITGVLVIPPLLTQIAGLGDAAPGYLERYHEVRDAYEDLREQYPALSPFDDQVAKVGNRIIDTAGDRLLRLPSTLFRLFLDLLSVFVISMLVITNRERILAFILSLVHPRHRDTTRDVLVKMWTRIGYYLRAKAIVMVIVGIITYFALLLLGVPFPLLLAVVVAFGEIVPRVGPWLARIPLLAIAALESGTTLLLTFIASVAIENAKGYFISPWVEGDQLDIHPLLVFIAVLIGSTLLGVAGAFIAVPTAAMLQVLADEVLIPWRRSQIRDTEAAPPDQAPAS